MQQLQSAVDAAKKLAGEEAAVVPDVRQAQELIAYAHRLSFTTSAPPGFVPGQTPLGLFKPPAPQDMQLRSSVLHQFQRQFFLLEPFVFLLEPFFF